jgi:hypothetical protein
LLADRYMCAWTEIVMLKQRGVDSVTRLHHLRKIDFRGSKHLGPGDHIIEWPKPRKPHSIDQKTYDTLPDFLMVRETRVQVEQPGFRTRTIIVVTTLLVVEEITSSLNEVSPVIGVNAQPDKFSQHATSHWCGDRLIARPASSPANRHLQTELLAAFVSQYLNTATNVDRKLPE